ncbi:isochorismatase family protein [Streptomyces sp. NPDC002888]|uniref:isochorismatase family protein n=1 Tax=Streptomyces sp. NPDC002888 TaxID=3364668 RepID=UPI003683F4B2
MAIPTISPYPLPAEGDLPVNRTGWRVDPDRAVLLVHDMQQYFVDFFPAGQAPMADVVRNIDALRRAAAEQGVPVAYTAQPGGMTPLERGLLRDFWGPGMDADPERRRIVAPLAPGPDDIVLTKWRYSAFARTELHEVMTARGRDQLVVCGIYAHIGCLMTACDAFTRDVQPFMVADAVADFSLEDHLMALDWAAGKCAVTLSTGAVVAALLGRPD